MNETKRKDCEQNNSIYVFIICDIVFNVCAKSRKKTESKNEIQSINFGRRGGYCS